MLGPVLDQGPKRGQLAAADLCELCCYVATRLSVKLLYLQQRMKKVAVSVIASMMQQMQ
jgi:hypothetical protein